MKKLTIPQLRLLNDISKGDVIVFAVENENDASLKKICGSTHTNGFGIPFRFFDFGVAKSLIKLGLIEESPTKISFRATSLCTEKLLNQDKQALNRAKHGRIRKS